LVSWAPAILIVFCLNLQANNQLYRYKNDEGVPVINFRIPPEFVHKGYDIINPDGSLIRKIPRALSKEELLLRNTDESRVRFAEQEEQRLRAWDNSLMLRYSSMDDIEAAQERAMRDLKVRISILKSNLTTIKSQIEREQLKAANIERSGGEVPEEMSGNIDILRLDIEDTEQSIAARRDEIDSVNAAFARDMNRFTALQDRVNMRRQQYKNAPAKRSTNYQ
jgi:chromosome segregation ATPase